MTKQNIKLTVMFILCLPGLPLTCLCWLVDRCLSWGLPVERRMLPTKEHFVAFMFASTVLMMIILLIVRLAK